MKRLVLWLLIAAAVPVGRVAAYEYAEVTLDYVAAKALQRAQKPFHSPKVDFPDFLREDKLEYDKYREIEFRHEDALWANQPLPVTTFNPSIGAPFPGARVSFATIGSPARFGALTDSGDNLSSAAFCSSVAGASMRV